MSIDPAPGLRLPIPCRSCGEVLIPFTVEAGEHPLNCPGCGCTTGVDVRNEQGVLRIRTQPQARPIRATRPGPRRR